MKRDVQRIAGLFQLLTPGERPSESVTLVFEASKAGSEFIISTTSGDPVVGDRLISGIDALAAYAGLGTHDVLRARTGADAIRIRDVHTQIVPLRALVATG